MSCCQVKGSLEGGGGGSPVLVVASALAVAISIKNMTARQRKTNVFSIIKGQIKKGMKTIAERKWLKD